MLLRIPTQSIGGACQGDRLTSEGESSHAEGDAAVPGLHHEHFKELTKSPSNEEAREGRWKKQKQFHTKVDGKAAQFSARPGSTPLLPEVVTILHMDLLGAYASDDESPPPAPSTSSAQSHEAKVSPKERRRRLDLSVLPPHIQDLLTGRGNDDSDSDEEVPLGARTLGQGSRSETRDLLAMLPRPGHEAVNKRQQPSRIFSSESADDMENTRASASAALVTSDPLMVPPVEEVSLPPFQALPKRSAAPSVHISRCGSATSGTSSAIESSSIISREFTRGVERARKRTRREEREIERSLLTGDVSTISGAHFIDVQGKQPWDSSAYDDRRHREEEVLSVYNFGGKGGEKAIMQPTKVQNKRHHINSLAMHAAETELALLDARGQRSKSKAETMAKYGW